MPQMSTNDHILEGLSRLGFYAHLKMITLKDFTSFLNISSSPTDTRTDEKLFFFFFFKRELMSNFKTGTSIILKQLITDQY